MKFDKLLVTIPHWSKKIPKGYEKRILERSAIWKHIDPGTDQLFNLDKAKIIKAKYTRFVVDLNRRRNDFSNKGVLIKVAWDGEKVWKNYPGKQETELLLQTHYDPFFESLKKWIAKQNGTVLHVDGHSMNPFGGSHSIDVRKERPDICLMDNHQSTCLGEFSRELKEDFEKLGYWTEIGLPYSGRKSAIINKLSDKEKIHSIGIEVNKRLYMGGIEILYPKKIKVVRNQINKVILKHLK